MRKGNVERVGNPRGAQLFAAVFAALFLALSLWALASPLLSSPDEPAHIVRAAAVVRGQVLSERTADDAPSLLVEVPAYTHPKDGLCFAGDPTKSAECQSDVWPYSTATTDVTTSASSNNPVYYIIVGIPTLFLDNAPALYAMRILNAAIVAALMAMTITAVRMQANTAIGAALAAVAITPTALFLGGTVNPNSVEMASAGALLAATLLLFRTEMDRRSTWLWSGAAAVSAILLLSGRSVALLWLFLIFVVIVATVGFRRLAAAARSGPIYLVIGVAAAAATGMFLWTRMAVPAIIDPIANIPPMSHAAVFSRQFQDLIPQIHAWIGAFGWLDYHAPAGILFLYQTIIGATVLSAIAVSRPRIRVALVVGIVGVLFIPSAIQVSLYDDVGWMWQGRYLLALFFIIMVIAGIGVDQIIGNSAEGIRRYIRPIVRAGAVVVGIAQTASFAHVMRRYVVGDDLGWREMVLATEWQPPGGWLTLTTLYAATMTAGVVLVWIFTSASRSSLAVETPRVAAAPTPLVVLE